MTKQTYFLEFLLTKVLAFILVSIALVFAYSEIKHYNVFLSIRFHDYEINTYAGVIFFFIILFIVILLFINGIFNSIVNSFRSYSEKYRGSKINSATSYLIESSILLAFGGKKEASAKIDKIDKKYLTQEQLEYADLIQNMSSSDTIPITLYGYINRFPFIRNQLSKKLSIIEFKLGNLEKALEYAMEYHSSVTYDEEINLIIAKIYAELLDWKSMDGTISSIVLHEISEQGKKTLAGLYFEAAKDSLKTPQSNETLNYCAKSLEFLPDNVEAAELFAEVAISQKKYDLVRECLLKAFGLKPNFMIFLILKKFSDATAEELYQQLVDSSYYQFHQDLFLAIATVLDLPDKQKEILEKIL